jgi:hypothetical protein
VLARKKRQLAILLEQASEVLSQFEEEARNQKAVYNPELTYAHELLNAEAKRWREKADGLETTCLSQ